MNPFAAAMGDQDRHSDPMNGSGLKLRGRHCIPPGRARLRSWLRIGRADMLT
jgi:hypothetical protein